MRRRKGGAEGGGVFEKRIEIRHYDPRKYEGKKKTETAIYLGSEGGLGKKRKRRKKKRGR